MKRLCIALCTLIALSACGGGGGGSNSPGGVVPQGGNIKNVSVQRAVSSQALLIMQSYGLADSFGGSLLASMVRRGEVKTLVSRWKGGAARPFSKMRHTSASVTYGPCTNGIETASVTISPTETQVYERTFYDAACTTLYQDIFVDIAANSSTSAVGAGDATQYDQSGNVIAYDSFSVSVTVTSGGSQVSIQVTNSPDAQSPPDATTGVSCLLTSSTSQSCGMGSIQNVTPLSKDVGLTMTFTETPPSTPSGTSSVTGNGTSFSGALNSLVLGQGTFPAWTITGGTAGNTFTISAALANVANGAVMTGSFSLVDSADNGTVNLNVGSSGVTGTIVQTGTGATVATLTTNLDGNGTITYSDGTTAQIVDWIITG